MALHRRNSSAVLFSWLAYAAIIVSAVLGLGRDVTAQDFVQTNATLSEQRGYLAATSSGHYAYFGGGSPYSSTVDIFDATSRNWLVANLGIVRSGLAATSVGDRALFAGGYYTGRKGTGERGHTTFPVRSWGRMIE
jgi:hypothetical protein